MRPLRLATRGADRQDGSVTLPYVVAVGFSLVVFTVMANLVVFQYGRGALRAAVDEGARAGARAVASADAAHAACLRVATATRDGLLGGGLGSDVTLACEVHADRVLARARATFAGWLPLVPDLTVSADGLAVREGVP